MINRWHRFAYLYLERGLKLDELVKVWVVNSVARHGVDGELDEFSWNVFDNYHVYAGLIMAVVERLDGRFVGQREFGPIIGVSGDTIKRTARRMEKEGYITRYIRNPVDGTRYTILKPFPVPSWLLKLGDAMYEIYTSPKLKKNLKKSLGMLDLHADSRSYSMKLRAS